MRGYELLTNSTVALSDVSIPSLKGIPAAHIATGQVIADKQHVENSTLNSTTSTTPVVIPALTITTTVNPTDRIALFFSGEIYHSGGGGVISIRTFANGLSMDAPRDFSSGPTPNRANVMMQQFYTPAPGAPTSTIFDVRYFIGVGTGFIEEKSFIVIRFAK